MSTALFLDCSTANAAWAFIRDDSIVAGGVELAPPSASVTLADRLQKLFKEQPQLLTDLKAVYVANGPGSFTGLRVGLALGKGIAYASRVPLVGFSSLQSIACSALQKQQTQFVAATIDAKKHEIYGALYQVEATGLKEVIPAGAYAFSDFSEKMSAAVGTASLQIAGTGASLVSVPGAALVDIAATPEGLLALQKGVEIPQMSDGELYNSWNLRPFYARLSEAEIGLLNREKHE